MPHRDLLRRRRRLGFAVAVSLIVHGAVLFLAPEPTPHPLSESSNRLPQRMDARLAAPRAQAPAAAAQPGPPPQARPPRAQAATPAKPRERKKILAVEKPGGPPASQASPKWSVAEKEEMNRFLADLEGEAQAEAKARPNLAERSLAMARQSGRQRGRPDDEGVEIVERVPGSPTIDPFSLEMYFDALLKKLNRSAQFVRNDPRSKGVGTASLVVRLNPDGSLRAFQVLEAADQQEQIAFIEAVVGRAVPFSPFPADILKSARSLALVICIRPAGSGEGGFGFTRMPNGRAC